MIGRPRKRDPLPSLVGSALAVVLIALGIALAVALTSCQGPAPLTYSDDGGFMTAALAQDPEFMAYVNGDVCQDMAGKIGMCSRKVRYLEDVQFRLNPMPYAFRLTLTCSENVAGSESFDVQPNVGWAYIIDHSKYAGVKAFLCIGEVFPADRPGQISARFEFRARVVDMNYVDREKIQVQTGPKSTIVTLGQNALYGQVCVPNTCKAVSRQPTVELTPPVEPGLVTAWSESYQMRFNYWFGEAR